MHRFFAPELTENSKSIFLSEIESKHAIQVLRLQIGQEIEVFNGIGISCIGKINDNNPKKAMVEVFTTTIHPSEQQLHIAISPTKNMDRMEWFVEKATEIGVTEISFIICQNSERRDIKIERLEKIILSAVKQSGRNFIPTLNSALKWKQFIEKYPKGLIAHCREGNKNTISQTLNAETILIGPEGDFSESEIQQALNSGYSPITLGNNRLRTETAGLVACVEARNRLFI